MPRAAGDASQVNAEPAPAPGPAPEPAPEPMAASRESEKEQRAGPIINAEALKRPSERAAVVEKPQEWRHGEIYFAGTGVVSKFLVVPDHIVDPEQVLQVMLGSWGVPMPNMTISVHTAPGNPSRPVDSRSAV